MMHSPLVAARCAAALLLMLCFSALTLPEVVSAEEQPQLTMDEIARAWRAKHERIRSGRFTWTETLWLRKGYYSALPVPGQPKGKHVPAHDTTFTYDNALVFDGEMMRYESDRPQPHIRHREIMPHRHISVWNRAEGKVFREHEEFPTGEIHDLAYDLAQSRLFAFRVAFRMLHPQWFNLDLEDYLLSTRRDIIDGFPCVVIETSPILLREKAERGRRPLKSSYWISPDQDFAPVRFTLTLNGRGLTDLSVFYRKDPQHGWYPAKWTFVEGSTEPPSEIVEAIVTEHALNVPVDPGEFAFEFPKGTWVRDMRSRETFIARGDGDRRIVTDEERRRGAQYEDLLETESGMAKAATPQSHGRLWLVSTATVLAVVALGIILMMRRRGCRD